MKIAHNSINKQEAKIKQPVQKASTWAQRATAKGIRRALAQYPEEELLKLIADCKANGIEVPEVLRNYPIKHSIRTKRT